MKIMNYKESKEWLYSLKFAMEGFKLDKTRKLAKLAKLDLTKLKTIHIAGSNGKGSTGAFIEFILKEQGYKTGFYTSPHLVEPIERMKINNKNISEKRFMQLTNYFRKLMAKNNFRANYFEVITVMAFKYFIEEKIDLLISEVGLGGRLDATNVLDGIISVITRISLEHTQYLGKNISKIAKEKAGIIKKRSTVIVAKNNPGLKQIQAKAKEQKSRIVYPNWIIKSSTNKGQEFELTKPEKILKLKIKMLGKHQCENAAIATATVISLRGRGFDVSEKSIRNGLRKAFWNARLEIVKRNPIVLLDAAHNPEGWKRLFESLKLFKYEKLIVVFGAMHDKDINVFRKYLRKINSLIITKSDSFRAEKPEKLKKKLEKGNIIVPEEKAIKQALTEAGKKDLVLITGSIYVVGKAFEILKIKTIALK
ncbi:MAG: bifunctional folylpolyglutamate synthase/dihydrofolate synthase [Candidatus Diapherotrites archaeon]|uniref:Probable bifunctional folylpolyglutamate synthase/dihydropteroate synthase n=1 Tax=Candidatus Iainarchaeum sp. TaxID=3101447 RepID=A0A2D6LPF0_9ARCH|nr:bifunctional folylpolyglutamate synthase/dihydrofolate synthase [Candidatus Diapherotrites archaeon]|tara:strand:+ start:7048 stop:8316 length:1269 start_codon:yes stop_codon:yes gene_type:complete